MDEKCKILLGYYCQHGDVHRDPGGVREETPREAPEEVRRERRPRPLVLPPRQCPCKNAAVALIVAGPAVVDPAVVEPAAVACQS